MLDFVGKTEISATIVLCDTGLGMEFRGLLFVQLSLPGLLSVQVIEQKTCGIKVSYDLHKLPMRYFAD